MIVNRLAVTGCMFQGSGLAWMTLPQKENSGGQGLVSHQAGITGVMVNPAGCQVKTVVQSLTLSGLTPSAMFHIKNSISCVSHHHRQSRRLSGHLAGEVKLLDAQRQSRT